MTNPSLTERDLNHIWHPCSQMKDFELSPPLIIQRAKGSYLYTDTGPMIDAISSWWCKSLGHGHPAITKAIRKQLNSFEHVIGAGTTHPKIVELAEKLTEISRKQHVFFASDGSSAVEIGMKLSLHAQQLKGHPERQHFIALENGYHGETLGTLGVSDLGLYKEPYKAFQLPCKTIKNIPYVSGISDPLWNDASSSWAGILKQIEPYKNTAAAIIIEPIVQGAGGMRIYSADLLKRLSQFAKSNGIYLIADEIMTGLGRTGKWLACQHAEIEPDIICLSKGLTSGSLPFSCTLIDHSIYSLFYDDYDKGKSFLHSHTYSGNALAASAALATLQTMETNNINQLSNELGALMYHNFSEVAQQSGKLSNIRSIGAIVAAELAPHPSIHRIGHLIAREAQQQGAILRPLGNTLYWLPPLTTNKRTIVQLSKITLNSIKRVYKL